VIIPPFENRTLDGVIDWITKFTREASFAAPSDSFSAAAEPIGAIKLVTAGAVEDGWLSANRQAVLKSGFPKLYSVIGDTHNGNDTVPGMFRVPGIDAPAGAVWVIRAT
jgi:hypothetical protein